MPATITDSIIFRHIFSSPESAQIWSDEGRIKYYLKFESALAVVEGRLGIIPNEAASLIQAHCILEKMDMAGLAEDTVRIGYPVLPVVKQIVNSVNKVQAGLGEWVHWGATTQDVTDTATVLQLRDTCQLLSQTLRAIVDALRQLSLKYAKTPMAGRSNLQQAVPMTFGFKMARLLATFQRHQQRLSEILNRLSVIEFGGAVGTLASLAATGLAFEVQEGLAQELELKVPEIAWHTERDRIAELGGFFALLTGTCAKFALDVKLLMQTEVGEVSEPYGPHRGSSSTMPQKRNPISSAYITAMASTVRALSAGLFDAMVEDHERSTGPWEIEWIVLPQMCTLTHATLKHTQSLLEGLEVHPDAMKRNLTITNGAISSEAVMMGLGKSIGRQYAHDLVYDVCRAMAANPSLSFVDHLLQNEVVVQSGITKEELVEICEPGNYVGLSEAMVHRVLELA